MRLPFIGQWGRHFGGCSPDSASSASGEQEEHPTWAERVTLFHIRNCPPYHPSLLRLDPGYIQLKCAQLNHKKISNWGCHVRESELMSSQRVLALLMNSLYSHSCNTLVAPNQAAVVSVIQQLLIFNRRPCCPTRCCVHVHKLTWALNVKKKKKTGKKRR